MVPSVWLANDVTWRKIYQNEESVVKPLPKLWFKFFMCSCSDHVLELVLICLYFSFNCFFLLQPKVGLCICFILFSSLMFVYLCLLSLISSHLWLCFVTINHIFVYIYMCVFIVRFLPLGSLPIGAHFYQKNAYLNKHRNSILRATYHVPYIYISLLYS